MEYLLAIRKLTTNNKEDNMKKTFDGVENKREFIDSFLKEIGWKLRHHGHEHYSFYNHEGEPTHMMLVYPETDGRIEFNILNASKDRYKMPSFTFYLKDLTIELMEEDSVCFGGKTDENLFILCNNFDKNKAT